MLHVHARYGAPLGSWADLEGGGEAADRLFGHLPTLLRWHLEFAPDAAEIRRHDAATELMGFSNLFVERPDSVFHATDFPILGAAAARL